MFREKINPGTVGLVFRDGDYKRVITEGKHWVSPLDRLVRYDRSKSFPWPIDLNILLRDDELKSLLEVVDVKDDQIVLQYTNGNLNSVLTPGRYAYWKGVTDWEFKTMDLSKVDITENINMGVVKRRELVPFVRVCKIESYEKGVLFIDNKEEKILGPGEYYFWKNAQNVTVSKVDLRQAQLEITGQEILTSDKAALRINFMIQYKVVDIQKAVIDNKDYERQLYTMVQLALREYVGTFSLDELLEKKEEIGDYVKNALKEKVVALGVKINDAGVKDVILPGDVKSIMNQVLVAQKQAQANVITRREETASTRSLLNTAKLMEDNEMLYKLKEMEYVEKIADKIGEITVAGNGQVIDQLRSIFTPTK
ncbi:slipin family protein [Fulvivirga maritima]|uniref:slipin family protein n=1 Tax=Fulvivirga maritima TaxID=2904247 RepID=UPI001F324508|nr:slipin family protein [Fulvivirga maritima]UII28948.1 slipin family protein [Fulvivirga maritima]